MGCQAVLLHNVFQVLLFEFQSNNRYDVSRFLLKVLLVVSLTWSHGVDF